jgi:hypothetical protein
MPIQPDVRAARALPRSNTTYRGSEAVMAAATAVVGVHPRELSRWLNGYQADLKAEHAKLAARIEELEDRVAQEPSERSPTNSTV